MISSAQRKRIIVIKLYVTEVIVGEDPNINALLGPDAFTAPGIGALPRKWMDALP
ncbi:3334_t:CDS:2, partial [Ambispora gerdemannii]